MRISDWSSDVCSSDLYPDAGESIEEATQPENVERKLQQIVPTGQPYVVEEIRPYRIHMRIVDRYRNGRIVMSGDAAHLNSPSGGMGMKGGLHYAHELMATLADIANGGPLDLLSRYVLRQRPIAEPDLLDPAPTN